MSLEFNDYELLSAYIDGEITEDERRTLESRLMAEPELQQELTALRQTVALVTQLPTLKAPRDFTLTRAMVAQRRRLIAFPLVSALSAAAAVVLIALGILMIGTEDASNEAIPAAVYEPEVGIYSNTYPSDATSLAAAPTPTQALMGSMTEVAAFEMEEMNDDGSTENVPSDAVAGTSMRQADAVMDAPVVEATAEMMAPGAGDDVDVQDSLSQVASASPEPSPPPPVVAAAPPVEEPQRSVDETVVEEEPDDREALPFFLIGAGGLLLVFAVSWWIVQRNG